MNETGNKYALAALKEKRASIAGEIAQKKTQIARLQKTLEHVDETIRVFDPAFDVGALPAKRPRSHVNLFRQGELGRLIVDALRRAGRPLSAREIVTALMEARGYDETARPALAPRVRGNLAYLHGRGVLVKEEAGDGVTWALTDTR